MIPCRGAFVNENSPFFFEKKRKKHLHIYSECGILFKLTETDSNMAYPGVAKFGIALEWGSRGRWFESSHSDQKYQETASIADSWYSFAFLHF